MFLRRITILRYRGIETLEWYPNPGLNCLIGPGDSGKSTILAAIALLLTPNPSPQISEYDFFKRHVNAEFEIAAVLAGIDDAIIDGLRVPALWGWKGRALFPLPDEGDAEPVLHVRVVGTPQLEVRHEILRPSGEPKHFSAALRQKLVLSRVSGEDRAVRELRLGHGSLLGRHLGEVDLRVALTAAIANASANLQMPESAMGQIETLRAVFAAEGLPEDLRLGLVPPTGAPILAMVSLLDGVEPTEAIPLAFAGAGTRQAALFALTIALMDEGPLVIVDEPESGLEPYRQRMLITRLRDVVGSTGQAFLSTHAPSIIGSIDKTELWRLVKGRNPLSLGDTLIEDLILRAPDAFLSRLPVLCEGDTEAGFLGVILEEFARRAGVPGINALGIRLVADEGQPRVLDRVKAVLNLGMRCGVFVDAELTHTGKREELAANPDCAFGSWTRVRNIEEAVTTWYSIDRLDQLVAETATFLKTSLVSLQQQVCERARQPGKATFKALCASIGEEAARSALAKSMQDNTWYKGERKGSFLGQKLIDFELPSQLHDTLEAFWLRLRAIL
jgi:putative ATP-dependent endonuclease of OLD family